MHAIPLALPADLPLAFLAKATILLVAALIVTMALRRAPAGARHLVWLGSLVAVLALPALSRWLPLRLEVVPSRLAALATGAPGGSGLGTWHSALGAGGDASTGAAAYASTTFGGPPPNSTIASLGGAGPTTSPQLPANQRGAPRAAHDASPAAIGALPAAASRGIRSAAAAGLTIPWSLLALWATVALGLVGWLVAGAVAVSRIIRGARVLDGPDWMAPLWEVADRLDLAEAPRLLASTRVEMPFACGVLRPTIILPAAAEAWSDDRRRAVLFHELAHVRRRDLIGHTLGRLACAIYWFHPLVWTAARRLRTESERACDDLVLACGTRASDYADHLLEIVTSGRRVAAPAVVLPMARRSEFEGRMLAILDPEVRRGGPSRAQSAALVAGLAALALSVAAMAPARPAAAATDRAPRPDAVSRSAASSPRPAGGTTREAEPQAAQPSAPGATARTDRVAAAATRDPVEATRVAEPSGRTRPQADTRAEPPVERTARTEMPDTEIAATVETPPALRMPQQPAPAAARPDTPAARATGSERIAMLLRVLRTDADASVRRTAAWALNGARGEEVSEGLLAALRRDADASVREMALWALAGDARQAVLDGIVAALQGDQSAEVRETAAWALGNAGGRAALDALDEAVRDGNARVRATAAWAIGQARPRRAPGALIAALADADAQVRLTAAWALGQILDPATAPMLAAAFDAEPNDEVRRAELRALAFLGDRSTEVLERALASRDAELRSRATQMLAGRGPGVWPWPWPQPRPRPHP